MTSIKNGLLILGVLSIIACNNNPYPYTVRLLEKNVCSDSIRVFDINYYSADSISMNYLLLIEDSVIVIYRKHLLKKGDEFYEFMKYSSIEDSEIELVDTIKIFGLTDTSFIYAADNNAAVAFGLNKHKYTIKQIDKNLFRAERTILSDLAVWRYTYYYDSNYRIKKIETEVGNSIRIFE